MWAQPSSSSLCAARAALIQSPLSWGRGGGEDVASCRGARSGTQCLWLLRQMQRGLCPSESRFNIQWSPHCIPAVYLTEQNYLFHISLLQRIVKICLISIKSVNAPSLVENQNGWSFCVAVMVDLSPTYTVTCCGFKRLGFWEMTLLTFCYLQDQCFDLEEQLKERSFGNNILKHQLYQSILKKYIFILYLILFSFI